LSNILSRPYFTPPQIEMWNSESKRQARVTGRRLGKTHELMYRAVDMAIRVPGSRTWYVGPSFPLIKPQSEILTAWLREKNALSHHNRQDNIWTTVNGGMIQFKSADDPESLRGWDCDLVILDEASLCKEGAFQNCLIATSVRDGTLILSMNVPEPDHLGYEWSMKLIHDWQRDDSKDVFIFPTWENSAIYADGRQDPKILELEKTLPPDVFARRVGADLRVLTGLVYPEFDDRAHVVTGHIASRCLVSIDPAYGSAASVHFYDWDGRTLTAYDEIYRAGMTDPDIVSEVMGHKQFIELIVYDNEDPGLRALFIEAYRARYDRGEIAEPFENIVPCDKRISVHEGIMTVKTWFHTGRVHIDKRCDKMLWELRHYAWAAKTEVPVKKNDHAMDDMRYLITTLDAAERQVLDMEPEEVYTMERDPEIDAAFGGVYA